MSGKTPEGIKKLQLHSEILRVHKSGRQEKHQFLSKLGNGKDSTFREILNESLKVFFRDALKATLRNPIQAYYFLRTIRSQKKAARVRSNWEQQGIHVPPIMIFSIMNRCNLHCKGCYNQALRQSPQEEMSEEKLKNVIAEAKDLGISFIVIGGGEQLIRPRVDT